MNYFDFIGEVFGEEEVEKMLNTVREHTYICGICEKVIWPVCTLTKDGIDIFSRIGEVAKKDDEDVTIHVCTDCYEKCEK